MAKPGGITRSEEEPVNGGGRYCVYCASSRRVGEVFFEAAARLGRSIAEASGTIVYGGGAVGLMGKVAEAALGAGGRVVGVIPEFMKELEWAHPGITELEVVEDMHVRKQKMIEGTDGVVALPGGCGTLEELVEAITWKRLGIYFNPIVIVNVAGFYDPLVAQLNRCVDERFMSEEHRSLWSVVDKPEAVVETIRRTPPWHRDAVKRAVVK